MLDGIKVLNKITEKDVHSWWWIPIVCILIVTVIIGIIWAILEDESICFWTPIIIGVLLIMLYSFFIPENIPTGEYTYQVLIDDSVNLKEFDSKYEIINQEGEIYTIKEK